MAKRLVGEGNNVQYEIINDVKEDSFEPIMNIIDHCYEANFPREFCVVANEADMFEIYVSYLAQQTIADKEHVELFNVNDTIDDHAVKEEEEKYSPQNLMDRFILGFGDEESETPTRSSAWRSD